MQDLQLALVISRLYECEFGTAPTYKKILQRHILGQDKQASRIVPRIHQLYIDAFRKHKMIPQGNESQDCVETS